MQLGWVDFSKEDRQKVYDVMHLLQEKGAVDELGIGTARDAFANYFFPGTSTIQTRAKYFLIVPYILKEAGDGEYGKDLYKVLGRIDEKEKECGQQFMKHNPGADGIVGSRVLQEGGWVARKPSDIYWSGIRTFGIFKESLSISEYVYHSLKLNSLKEKGRSGGNRGDDKKDTEADDMDAGDFTNYGFWNIADVYRPDWDEDLSIELTGEEAKFLKKRIIRSVPDSLLAFILKNHVDMSVYGQFAHLSEDLKASVPANMADMMKLACDFNDLVYMARVRYNVLLSEGCNEEANDEWDYLSGRCKQLAKVDLDKIFSSPALNIYNPTMRIFLFALQESFQKGDIKEADAVIRRREAGIKHNRAKLSRTKEFDPQNWVGGRMLDFRMSNARTIVSDIYHGEEVAAHV